MATATKQSKVSNSDIYEEVNQRIQTALKAGTVPWRKPWAGELSAPRNLQSGKAYRGINALLLAFSDYTDPRWSTYKAAANMGGQVRKGEKSTLVTLWKRIVVKDQDAPNGKKIIPMLRYFRVFNVEQIDFPEGAIQPWDAKRPDDWNPIAEGDRAFSDYIESDPELSLGYGGNSAHYQPAAHHIQLPERESFRKPEGFYSTAFHEAAHSTGKALDRGELSGNMRADSYSREELVAEITGAFVCATLGIEPDYDNSAAYIKHWSEKIHDDPKLMVKAAGQAQKAADRILGTEIQYDN